MVDLEGRVVSEHLNRHDRGEAATGAVGAGGELAAVAGAGRVLEQTLGAYFVEVRREVVQSEVVDDCSVECDGLLHTVVPDCHPVLVALDVPVIVRQVDPGSQSLDVGPQMGHRADGAVDQSCSVVVALDVDLALDLGLASVTDVDYGVLDEILHARVGVGVLLLLAGVADRDLLGHERPEGVVGFEVPVVDVRCDHQTVAVEHHLHRVALDAHVRFEREFAELRHPHDHQQVSVEHVDVKAVGLEEVRLVDAFLLIVGLGVLALAARVRVGG